MSSKMDIESVTSLSLSSSTAPTSSPVFDDVSVSSSSFVSSLEDDFDAAEAIEDTRQDEAIRQFWKIFDTPDPKNLLLKLKEDSIFHIGKIYAKLGRTADFKALFIRIRPFFSSIAKSRTAKIVRSLIELVGEESEALTVQSEICEDAIAWCVEEKRTFLKQRIQSRLAALYLKQKRYTESLSLIQGVVREVRKFDDKLLMVELQLIESRVHLSLENVAKSKGALTSARSAANAIYCPPLLQAEIDMQAGILCAAEGDWKTAFSYFFECFDGFHTVKEAENALKSLKYMLLSKIMLNSYEDVYSIITGKAGIKYAGIEMEAMRAVADAYKARSIDSFEEVYAKYPKQLADDSIISAHLSALKEKLLEQNLIRLIEPFSRVEIIHLAELIKLPRTQVESKLSEMILDKKLSGILDQGAGDLILFDETKEDKSYESAIDTCKELSNVIDKLYAKATTLTS